MFLFSSNTFQKNKKQHKQNHLNLKIHEVSLSPFAAAQFIPAHLAGVFRTESLPVNWKWTLEPGKPTGVDWLQISTSLCTVANACLIFSGVKLFPDFR